MRGNTGAIIEKSGLTGSRAALVHDEHSLSMQTGQEDSRVTHQ